ncbi:MAG: Flp family type IVb pilin [bacterium]
MLRNMKDLIAREEAQGMVEYGLIVGLIAIIVIAVFVALGPQITALFEETVDTQTLEEGQTELDAAMNGDTTS